MSQTLFGLCFLIVIFFLPFTVFLLSLSHEIRIKKIRILEVLEPLQWKGETLRLLRLQRETSCINVFQVDYRNWFFQWIFYAIGYWSGFSLKEFFIGFLFSKTLCYVIVYCLVHCVQLYLFIYLFIYLLVYGIPNKFVWSINKSAILLFAVKIEFSIWY